MTRNESRQPSQNSLTNRMEIQVQKRSGTTYHLNIDALSLARLKEAKNRIAIHGERFTLSIIVRRAIRYYGNYLNTLQTDDERGNERIELDRAMKGIL